MPSVTILDAMADRQLFGRWFKPDRAWGTWRVFLAVLFGLPLSAIAAEAVRACTGRQTRVDGPAREAWVVVGRRGGKSRIAALVAVFLACFRDYRAVLAPGERGTVMII